MPRKRSIRICKKCDVNILPKGKHSCDECRTKTVVRICTECNVNVLSKGKHLCHDCGKKRPVKKRIKHCKCCGCVVEERNLVFCTNCRYDKDRISKLPWFSAWRNTKEKVNRKELIQLKRICPKCDTTELSKGKHVCDGCKKRYVYSSRVVKINIIIPDEIKNDPVEAKKYYKKEYAKIYYQNQDRKVCNQKARELRRIKRQKNKEKREKTLLELCQRHNQPIELFLRVKKEANRNTNTALAKQIGCKSRNEYILKRYTCVSCGTFSSDVKHYYKTEEKFYCDSCYIPPIPKPKHNKTAEELRNELMQKYDKLYVGKGIRFIWDTYVTTVIPVKLVCDKHGEFEKKLSTIFTSKHCPGCLRDSKKSYHPTTEDRIKESIDKFGDRFDYSKFDYKNKDSKTTFICKKHNTEFEQTFRNHITQKIGCPDCRNEKGFIHDYSKMGKSRIRTTEKRDFIKYKNKLRSRIMAMIKVKMVKITSNIDYKLPKDHSFEKIVGLSPENFKQYIESKFEPWMNWDNYGLFKVGEFNYGWDLDHIIPLSVATDETRLFELWYYTNLQPLCSNINRNYKRAKLDYQI